MDLDQIRQFLNSLSNLNEFYVDTGQSVYASVRRREDEPAEDSMAREKNCNYVLHVKSKLDALRYHVKDFETARKMSEHCSMLFNLASSKDPNIHTGKLARLADNLLRTYTQNNQNN